MLRCPHCNSVRLQVLDTRAVEKSSSVRRRRECKSCGERFYSWELTEAQATDLFELQEACRKATQLLEAANIVLQRGLADG